MMTDQDHDEDAEPSQDTDRPLPKPTRARPGSPAKIDVLAERVSRRETLFHPRDADE